MTEQHSDFYSCCSHCLVYWAWQRSRRNSVY